MAFAQGFNQMFQGPYAAALPPQMQQAMQQQNMMSLAAALMSQSNSRKDTLGATGDALQQYQQTMQGNSRQALEMARLQQMMQQAQGIYEGKDAASILGRDKLTQDQSQFDRRDKTARRGQDLGVEAARLRNPFAFGFPGGPAGPGGPGMPTPRINPTQDGERAAQAFRDAPEPKEPPGTGREAANPPKRGGMQQLMQREPESGAQVMQMLRSGELDKPENLYYSKPWVRKALELNMFGAGEKRQLEEWLREKGG